MNWTTQARQPRAIARIAVPKAAVDLPLPSPVLTMTTDGALTRPWGVVPGEGGFLSLHHLLCQCGRGRGPHRRDHMSRARESEDAEMPLGSVSWLADLRCWLPSQGRTPQWLIASRSPLTVARQRRIRTGFPCTRGLFSCTSSIWRRVETSVVWQVSPAHVWPADIP